jgi:hypothetical protein
MKKHETILLSEKFRSFFHEIKRLFEVSYLRLSHRSPKLDACVHLNRRMIVGLRSAFELWLVYFGDLQGNVAPSSNVLLNIFNQKFLY